MFGYSEEWNAEDLKGGINSDFAKTFSYAVKNSERVYFNLDGFNLGQWKRRYNTVNEFGFNEGTTAWELTKLSQNSERHFAIRFCTGNSEMEYSQFRNYCVDQLRFEVQNDKVAIPNWRQSIANTIAILVVYLDFEEDFVESN